MILSFIEDLPELVAITLFCGTFYILLSLAGGRL